MPQAMGFNPAPNIVKIRGFFYPTGLQSGAHIEDHSYLLYPSTWRSIKAIRLSAMARCSPTLGWPSVFLNGKKHVYTRSSLREVASLRMYAGHAEPGLVASM